MVNVPYDLKAIACGTVALRRTLAGAPCRAMVTAPCLLIRPSPPAGANPGERALFEKPRTACSTDRSPDAAAVRLALVGVLG